MVNEAHTIWIQTTLPEEEQNKAASIFTGELKKQKADSVELVDAPQIARDAYKNGKSPLGMTLGLLASRMNAHGITVVIFGAKSDSDSIRWGRYKPAKLVDLSCERDPDNEDAFKFIPVIKASQASPTKGDSKAELENQDKAMLDYMKQLDQ